MISQRRRMGGPMESGSEERLHEDVSLSGGPGVLLILGAAVLVLCAAALAFSSVDAAIGGSSTSPNYGNGWSVGSVVFMYAGSAVYLPGVLLGMAALVLAQSKTTRGRAAKMAWPLFMLSVAVIIVGIGRAVCEVHPHLDIVSWPTAQTVLSQLGRSLVRAGTLAGLAYLCRQQVRSTTPCETNELDSKVDGAEA
jgi:hypothetical protein